jgi:hypothetical protein
MKSILFFLTIGLLLSGAALADIITETKTWTPVAITVDQNGNTYTVTGAVPADNTTEYYYTYPGYRCVTKEIVDVNGGVVYHSATTGGSDVWCYAETP